MQLEIFLDRIRIHIDEENREMEVAYIETVLKLKKHNDTIKIRRVNRNNSDKIIYLETDTHFTAWSR